MQKCDQTLPINDSPAFLRPPKRVKHRTPADRGGSIYPSRTIESVRTRALAELQARQRIN